MDYARYLRAKRSVDDRALNLHVLNTLQKHLTNHATSLPNTKPQLHVVEVGAGIGEMFLRLHDMNVFSAYHSVHYTLVDIKPHLLVEARHVIALLGDPLALNDDPSVSADHLTASCSATDSGVHHESGAGSLEDASLSSVTLAGNCTVSFHAGDAISFLAERAATFDLVIASAVLDLWQLDVSLPPILSALDPAGARVYYFPINFDATTDFFPPTSEGPTFDSAVEQAFHRAMGTRLTAGYTTQAAHTGRRLIPTLASIGSPVKTAGASAWIVSPQSDPSGPAYSGDEAFFLSCIIDFIEATGAESGEHPFCSREAFARYIAYRRNQIVKAELIYIAHNIDVFGLALGVDSKVDEGKELML